MRIKLTTGKVSAYRFEGTGMQSFLWDSDVSGFGVRATPAGKRSTEGTTAYIHQARLNGKPIRMTIGSTAVWSLEAARTEARRLQGIIDTGRDPRQVKAEATAADVAARDAAKAAKAAAQIEAHRATVTLRDAWTVYLEARQRPPMPWGERTLLDNQKIIRKPSQQKLANGKTRHLSGGALSPLADEPLRNITAKRVTKWLDTENESRSAQAALAFRMLSAFINWASTHPQYQSIVHTDACKSESRRHVQKPKAKAHDTLRAEQIKPWVEAIGRIPNKTIATYLTALLLTGARRKEMAALRWQDVDFSWNTLTIGDKVEENRTIPLPPYLRGLLLELHNLNQTPPNVKPMKKRGEPEAPHIPSEFVFSAGGKTGYLVSPDIAYTKAIAFAGLPHVTLHGLRRTFKNCADDAETPAGITAQIMGHKPSAIAERHYTHRSMDTLTRWHSRIEGYILEKAGITQPSESANKSHEVAA